MGCGWDPSPPADMSLVTSIEVVNGGGHPATRFWEDQLRRGYRLTAVGGSDNHHANWPPEHPGSVGYPTTVVYAQNLSVAGILDGIRSGRVFIDTTGSRDRMLDMNGDVGGHTAPMGGELTVSSGTSVAISAHIAGCAGGTVHFFVDGQESADLVSQPVAGADQTVHTTWRSDGAHHWLRAEVHDMEDHLVLLGNPIYINWPAHAD